MGSKSIVYRFLLCKPYLQVSSQTTTLLNYFWGRNYYMILASCGLRQRDETSRLKRYQGSLTLTRKHTKSLER